MTYRSAKIFLTESDEILARWRKFWPTKIFGDEPFSRQSFYHKKNFCISKYLRICGNKKYNRYHCVKSVRIQSFSGPYFLVFGQNTDHKNSEYRRFSHSVWVRHLVNPSNEVKKKQNADLFVKDFSTLYENLLGKVNGLHDSSLFKEICYHPFLSKEFG